jgi:hypothetical protein
VFTQRFPELDDYQRNTYVVTLLLAVVAAALFTAPAALHRVLFRRHAKRRIVQVSARFALAGLVFLALALTASVMLIMDVALSRLAGQVTGGCVALLFAWLWLLIPLWLRRMPPPPIPESSGPESSGPESSGPESSGPESSGPESSRPDSSRPGS